MYYFQSSLLIVDNISSITLSPLAILTSQNLSFQYYYLSKSETCWQKPLDIKPCLAFDIDLCFVNSSSYVYQLWLKLRSSPLLELYIRSFLTLLDTINIILQHDISAIKILEVSLKLKQNLFCRHDYVAYKTHQWSTVNYY